MGSVASSKRLRCLVLPIEYTRPMGRIFRFCSLLKQRVLRFLLKQADQLVDVFGSGSPTGGETDHCRMIFMLLPYTEAYLPAQLVDLFHRERNKKLVGLRTDKKRISPLGQCLTQPCSILMAWREISRYSPSVNNVSNCMPNKRPFANNAP